MHTKKHLSFSSLRKSLSNTINNIKDDRHRHKIEYSLHDTVMSSFACMYYQDPSLLQFQKRLEDELHNSNTRTLFQINKIPKETQIRETLDQIDSSHFEEVFKNFYMQLQRGKHLEQYRLLDGLYYCPIDGSEYYSSKNIHCENCLTKEHKKGSVTYSHQVLQGGIMHPEQKSVIPFMPEEISNKDGDTKQDCEMNAGKRFLSKIKKQFPKLKFIIGGDALFSRQPIIEDILSKEMHYIFVAKESDHKYMYEWLKAYPKLNSLTHTEKNKEYFYEWMCDVPLNGRKDSINTNFFRCTVITKNKKGEVTNTFKCCWVTDLEITKENIEMLVKTARCRWKNENEVFNVMKNHGYDMTHNYGHGDKNLCFNFYILTILAFYMHQIFELTDNLYKKCRVKFGSKRHMWETFRAYIKIVIFDT